MHSQVVSVDYRKAVPAKCKLRRTRRVISISKTYHQRLRDRSTRSQTPRTERGTGLDGTWTAPVGNQGRYKVQRQLQETETRPAWEEAARNSWAAGNLTTLNTTHSRCSRTYYKGLWQQPILPGVPRSILRLLDYNSGKQTHCKRKDEKANKSYLYRKGKKAQSRLVQESNNHLLNLESF